MFYKFSIARVKQSFDMMSDETKAKIVINLHYFHILMSHAQYHSPCVQHQAASN